MSTEKTIYVGMHDGVCAVTSEDGGSSWQQGPVTALPHAAARLAASPVVPGAGLPRRIRSRCVPHR